MSTQLALDLFDDRLVLLAEAEKRIGAKLPAAATTDARIARYEGLRAHALLWEVLAAHQDYVGPDGKAAANRQGLAITINKSIKKIFGKAVGTMITERDLIVLTRIREAVALAIVRGEKQSLDRSEIRRLIRTTIQNCYVLYGEY